MTERGRASEVRRAAIAALVRPHVVEAGRAIINRVLDVRAHAEKAMSASVIEMADGRRTHDKIDRSASMMTALERLDALHNDLAGDPGQQGGWDGGLIGDAWEAAFLDAWRHARESAHPDDLLPSEMPTKIEHMEARRIILSGYDARGLIEGPIANAKRTLKAVTTMVASKTRTDRERKLSLDGWQSSSSRSIAAAVGQAIFTGSFRQDVRAGRLVLKPELLHPDPTMGD